MMLTVPAIGTAPVTKSTGFEERWCWITNRAGGETNVVQERQELEHVYNLMRACDCRSYLEIGSAEGTSLYVLGSIPQQIDFIDFGEAHTLMQRNEVIELLEDNEKVVTPFIGNSTKPETFNRRIGLDAYKYDCVLIDGGHDFATVLSDSIMYAPLATKYVFWHDVQLPEVRHAVSWFVNRWKLGTYSEFIHSDSYGYGILEVGK